MTMYKAEDFNLENAPKEMVQYVIDNVVDFDIRYQRALYIIGRDRCPLRMADESLYNDIYEALSDWCIENDELCYLDDGCVDVEEIFG
jgi:hypothetical protein